MAENPHSRRRGPGSTPGQVTVSHMTKLRVHTPRWKIKDPACRNQDPHSRINVLIFKSPKLKPNQKSTLNRKRDSTAVVRFGKPTYAVLYKHLCNLVFFLLKTLNGRILLSSKIS